MTRDRDPGSISPEPTEPSTSVRPTRKTPLERTEVRERPSGDESDTQVSTKTDTARWSPPNGVERP